MNWKQLLSLAFGLIAACNSDGAPKDDVSVAKSSLAQASDPRTDDVAAVGGGNRAFAFDLYQQIAQASAGQNIVFSPHSLSTAFAMSFAGARTQTHAEMQSVLHFDTPEPQLHEAFNAIGKSLQDHHVDDTFRLDVNNALWAQKGVSIESPYLDTLALNYGAGVFLLDFMADPETARAVINDQVSKQTEMMIPMLLQPGTITPRTRFVLTNALDFHAQWERPFVTSYTTQVSFTKLDGSNVTVSMMHGNEAAMYAAGDGYQAAQLPYLEDSLKFIAVLPDEGMFDAIESNLSSSWFDGLTAQWSESANLSLPKLDLDQTQMLIPELKALGMHAAFSSDQADFSGMTKALVFITSVVHQATLQVDEQGSTGSAATAIVYGNKSGSTGGHDLTFDRPFLFAIFDSSTGELLFLGRVLDPTTN